MPYSHDRPVQNIERMEEALRDIDRRSKTFYDCLTNFGVDYLNKIKGNFSGDHDVVFRLRDMIWYRHDGFRFHLTLLLRTHNYADAALQSHSENKEGRQWTPQPIIRDRNARQQFAVFDSLMFHAISLFDYLAGLIKYICVDGKEHDWNWKSVRGAAFHHENQFSESVVADVVRDLNRAFVQRLYAHRAEVIHFSADLGGSTLIEKIGAPIEDRYDFKVFAPQGFVEKFGELKRLSESHDITLHYAGFWLCHQTIKGAIDIIEALREYVDQNRKVPEGEEPIQFSLSDDKRKGTG